MILVNNANSNIHNTITAKTPNSLSTVMGSTNAKHQIFHHRGFRRNSRYIQWINLRIVCSNFTALVWCWLSKVLGLTFLLECTMGICRFWRCFRVCNFSSKIPKIRSCMCCVLLHGWLITTKAMIEFTDRNSFAKGGKRWYVLFEMSIYLARDISLARWIIHLAGRPHINRYIHGTRR